MENPQVLGNKTKYFWKTWVKKKFQESLKYFDLNENEIQLKICGVKQQQCLQGNLLNFYSIRVLEKKGLILII